MEQQALCDFCCGPMPTWTVVCDKIDLPVLEARTVIKMSEDWGTCAICVKFLKDKNLDGLVERVCASPNINSRHDPDFKRKMIFLYKHVFKTMRSITEDGLITALSKDE